MTTPDYAAHNFVDGPAGGTPITAAILNDDEAAVRSLHSAVGFYVKDYGAKWDGVTDDSTAIASAVTAAKVAGGTVIFPAGVGIAANIPVSSNVTYRGVGSEATIVRLPPSSTADVFVTDNYATLVGTATGGGPTQWHICDLTIDGNKANAASGGVGLKSFSYGWRMNNVIVKNCHGHGMILDYSDATSGAPASGLVEPRMTNVSAMSNSGDGIHVTGAHDGMAVNVIAANNTGSNIYAGGSAWNWVNCHAWGPAQYAWYMTGKNHLVNCQGEGATIANFLIQWHECHITGGECFAPGSATAVGVQIYRSDAILVNNTRIDGMYFYGFSSGSGAAIDLTSAGSGLSLTGSINQASGTAIVGTAPTDANANVVVTGGLTNQSLYQLSGRRTLSATEVAFPPALADTFTGANAAVPDTTKWTRTVGTGTGAAVDINTNRLRLVTGGVGGYSANDRVAIASTLANTLVDTELLFRYTFGALNETYFTAGIRSSAARVLDGTGYAVEINTNADGSSYILIQSVAAATATTLYTGANFTPTVGMVKWVRIRMQGTSMTVRLWDDGTAEPIVPTYTTTNSAVTGGGLVTFSLDPGSAAHNTDRYVDNVAIFAL